MENVVYILGAGFSAPLGLPVMKDFWHKSRTMMRERPKEYDHLQKIIKEIDKTSETQNYFEYQRFNVEEALSILEMREYLGENSELEPFKRYIIEVIKHYTPTIPERSKPFPANWLSAIFGEDEDSIFQWYGHFVAALQYLQAREQLKSNPYNQTEREILLQKQKGSSVVYSVVTLNYDQVLESICEFMSQYFWERDRVVRFDRQYSPQKPEIDVPYLAKLHGSVDDTHIIPPTFNKGLYQPNLPDSWKLAYQVLSTANQIRIIGYSLPQTDSYIKYILKSSISQPYQLEKIDVLCRDSTGKVKTRYGDFINFDNCRFSTKRVEEYLQHNYQLKSLASINEGTYVFDKLEQAHEEFFGRNSTPLHNT